MMQTKRLVGWRYVATIGGFIGFLGVFIYPIIISPLLEPDHYSKFYDLIILGYLLTNNNWSHFHKFNQRPSDLSMGYWVEAYPGL